MSFNFPRLLVLLLACSLGSPVQAENETEAKESVLQAAFLYNFALLTDWPQLPETVFTICVLDSISLLEALDTVKYKQIKERHVEAKAIDSAAQAQACQVLFVGRRAHPDMREISNQIGTATVLVVSEENAYDLKYVIIALHKQQDRISFKINRTAANANSLTLSSRLLKLATQVY